MSGWRKYELFLLYVRNQGVQSGLKCSKNLPSERCMVTDRNRVASESALICSSEMNESCGIMLIARDILQFWI